MAMFCPCSIAVAPPWLELLADWFQLMLPVLLAFFLGFAFLYIVFPLVYPLWLTDISVISRPLWFFKESINYNEIESIELMPFLSVLWPPKKYRPMAVWPYSLFSRKVVLLMLREDAQQGKSIALIVLRPRKVANTIASSLQRRKAGA